MPSVCFYFEVHQPVRLRPYSFFQVGKDHQYFDEKINREITQKVAQKCYLPANKTILRLIEQHQGKFKVAYSITGLAIEQLKAYAPEALESFVELSKTGCVEFLAETYYHSLASLFAPEEFKAQIHQHVETISTLFGQKPKVFRNTELICNNSIAQQVETLGFKAILAEGADDLLQWRSPHHLYTPQGTNLKLLLKSYSLSDDIAFRFSNKAWSQYPITAGKYAKWIHALGGNADTINLFMDYETFGEHQWEATGIFKFLEELPSAILKRPEWNFLWPSEVAETYPSKGELPFHRTVSWADVERDTSAWQGNQMQNSSLEQVYALKESVFRRNNPSMTDMWRKLQASDHFYYMCTKPCADGDVHAYFSPYRSPYEAFITYMTVLTDLRKHVLMEENNKPSAVTS